ncbi:MAG TPA: hypothetical protein VFW92_05745 [Candidatus Limnocylindrales bacterium]|nr:hypothetical protein [Candidatus Limnocylindrales bacterium]
MEPRTFRGGSIYGIRMPTVFADNDAIRCAGCGQPITVVPFRVSLLDAAAAETAVDWSEQAPLNPGPHEFHTDPTCFQAWARERGYLLCRLSGVRELMRPVVVPAAAAGGQPRLGLCDAEHRGPHELVPA